MKLQHYGEREQSDNFDKTRRGIKSTPLYEPGIGLENGVKVPVTYHSTTIGPASREQILERLQCVALIIENRLLRWAMHDRVKYAALYFWSGRDRRQEKEVIKATGCSKSTFLRRLRDLRALAAEWAAELERGQ
jgi:hypothetical protein